uniref:Protein phosphatase, Mg2+/Mn2+ dependent, 1H n=1 Tax=Scophthalmus maximus TaxID=52904 RepID=A0A8D3D707_SCOMX
MSRDERTSLTEGEVTLGLNSRQHPRAHFPRIRRSLPFTRAERSVFVRDCPGQTCSQPEEHFRSVQARVLATIGVTRGLGDHNLKVHDSNIYIKPFLSCCPEVKVYPLAQCEHGADDVLVLGTDGLWDVLSNQEVNEAVTSFLSNCDPDDQHRYTMAAQDLIMRARGVLKDRGWRISNDRLGSGDDISVYIIPLINYNYCRPTYLPKFNYRNPPSRLPPNLHCISPTKPS